MSRNLPFSVLHPYPSPEIGISLPVKLIAGQNPVEFWANLDTGASYCIFQRGYGESLGLNIERGREQWIGQVNGRFRTYGHIVGISFLGFDFEAMVYFAEDPSINRNVLGRDGWLDRLRIAIIHYDCHLFLSDYNEPVDENS